MVKLPFLLQQKEIFWSVKVDISVSGVDSLAGNSSYTTQTIGLLDSGTTLITLPVMNYAAVMQVALGSARQMFCRLIGSGPMTGLTVCDCAVNINPVTFSIPDADGASVSVVLGKDELLRPLPPIRASPGFKMRPLCAVSIMPTPRNMPVLILGAAFLRHVHAIYDFGSTIHDPKQVRLFAHGSKASDRTRSFEGFTEARSQNAFFLTGGIIFAMPFSLALSCVALSAWRRRSSSLSEPLIGV